MQHIHIHLLAYIFELLCARHGARHWRRNVIPAIGTWEEDGIGWSGADRQEGSEQESMIMSIISFIFSGKSSCMYFSVEAAKVMEFCS